MAPLTKTARRELKRLERKLATARKNEAKRRRQATDAAADVAAIVRVSVGWPRERPELPLGPSAGPFGRSAPLQPPRPKPCPRSRWRLGAWYEGTSRRAIDYPPPRRRGHTKPPDKKHLGGLDRQAEATATKPTPRKVAGTTRAATKKAATAAGPAATKPAAAGRSKTARSERLERLAPRPPSRRLRPPHRRELPPARARPLRPRAPSRQVRGAQTGDDDPEACNDAKACEHTEGITTRRSASATPAVTRRRTSSASQNGTGQAAAPDT